MNTAINKKTILLLLLTISFNLNAQVTLKAYVSGNSVSVDDQFKYSVEISGASSSLPDINLPVFKDFYVLSGPNQSTSYQYINGKASASKTFTYYLQARAEGTFIIEKASAEVDGKQIESNTITITVEKGNPTTQKKNNSNTSTTSEEGISGSDLYLKSAVSKSSAFIGEQIIVEYKLYFRNQVRTYEIVQNPSAAGFWKEDFDLPAQPLITKEVINGLSYNVATLKKMAIFPTRVGKLELEPMTINVEAIVPNQRQSRQSLFDSFFEPSGRSVKQPVKSRATTLNISALPEKDKPQDFAGAVGNFVLSVNVDKTSAEVNEAVALKVRLSGTGNIKLAELPLVEIPTDIEQYEPKMSSNIAKTDNLISGFKQAEYILIPRIPGEFRIKPIQFSYYDPSAKKYFTKSSGPIVLMISGEAPAKGTTPMAGYSRKEVTMIGSDIRFIKESTILQNISERGYFSGLFLGGVLTGLLLFSGFLIYDDRQLKMAGNKVLVRSRRAAKHAAKILSAARLNLKKGNPALFYKSISTALSGFVQDKLNIELTDFNLPMSKTQLIEKGVPENLVSEYAGVIQECDFKQFASSAKADTEMESYLTRSARLITDMEKYI